MAGVVGFFGLWAAAWLVHDLVDIWWAVSSQPSRDLAYWALAKCLIWVGYPVLWCRRPLREQASFLGLRPRRLGRGLVVGLAAASGWVVLSIGRAMLPDGSISVSGAAGAMIWYAVLLTPVCEEVAFRGYLQSALVTRQPAFRWTNLSVSGLFLLVHCEGWLFQGVLLHNLSSAYPVTLGILSLLLGYVRYRSDSLVASIVLHMVNNALAVLLG